MMGELGGPARTVRSGQHVQRIEQIPLAVPTTSVRAPLLARRALRFFLDLFCSLQSNTPPVAKKATTAAVSARFLEIQSCRRCMYAPETTRGGGGGAGRAISGSQP